MKAFRNWYKKHDFWKDHEDDFLEIWNMLEDDFGVDEEAIEETFDRIIGCIKEEYGD